MVDFLKALGGWGISISILITIAFTFIILQLIGELLEVGGKVVPSFFKVRKFFKAKKVAKQEKEAQSQEINKTLADSKEQLARVETLINDFNKHYSEDNIAKRDGWMLSINTKMKWVDERAKVYDESVKELTDLAEIVKQLTTDLKTNNQMTSQLYKDINRHRILDFSHTLLNNSRKGEEVVYSEEEFNKIHAIYADYEEFLHTYGGTNGQVDNAMKIVDKAEAGEFPNIRIVSDLRDI